MASATPRLFQSDRVFSAAPALNAIHVGDCLDLIQAVPDASIDLTVFSPPYDNIRDYKKNWALDYQTLGAELHRVTVDGGICAVVIGDGTKDFANLLVSARPEYGRTSRRDRSEFVTSL